MQIKSYIGIIVSLSNGISNAI